MAASMALGRTSWSGDPGRSARADGWHNHIQGSRTASQGLGSGQLSPAETHWTLTQEDAAGHAGDALNLCEVVLGKVLITGGAGRGAVAEEAPERGGLRAIVGSVDFGTDVKAAS